MITIVTDYGPARVEAQVTDNTYMFVAICEDHGVIKSTKQSARAHSAARKHLVKDHGYRFDWTFEDNTWNHDAPFNLYAVTWLESDRWAWTVLNTVTKQGIATGDCNSRIAAQIMADLAIADTIKNGS